MRPLWGEYASLVIFDWTVAIAAAPRKTKARAVFSSKSLAFGSRFALTPWFAGDQQRRRTENRAGLGGAANAATAKRTGAAEGSPCDRIKQSFQPLETGPVGPSRYQHQDGREGPQPGL